MSEERQKAIETLKGHLAHWERLLKEHICDETEGKNTIEAFKMSISSLETDEAYQLEYERTTKNETLVSLGVYKQVAWERDIAIQQLHELGYEFGQKIEPTTKNDLRVDNTINRLDDFIEYAKKTFGIELTFEKSDNPDTYEKLFGTTKNDLGVECKAEDLISRQTILDMTGLSEWFDSSDSYNEFVFRICELPSVYPKSENTVSEETYTREYNLRKDAEFEVYKLKKQIEMLKLDRDCDTSALEDIKAEIQKHNIVDFIAVQSVLEIIDKHISGKETK